MLSKVNKYADCEFEIYLHIMVEMARKAQIGNMTMDMTNWA